METGSGTKCDKKAFEKVVRITFHGGRRRVAVLFDTLALSGLLLLALYLLALSELKNGARAFACASLAFTGIAAVLRFIMRGRFAVHRQKLLREARRNARRLRVMLEPEKLFDRIVPREGEFIHRRTDSLTSDDIAEAVKQAGLPVTIVTLAEPTNAASELIKLSCGQIETVSAQERAGAQLCSLFPVSEEEAKKTAVAMNGGCLKRFSLKKSVFALTRERALKYAAVGAGLYACSFFVKYALYYRIAASLALCIGAGVFAFEGLKKRG